MFTDNDRILGELAVEQCLITPVDLTRYEQELSRRTGSASLAQRLLEDGRVTLKALERLEVLWRLKRTDAELQVPTADLSTSWEVEPGSTLLGQPLGPCAIKRDDVLAYALLDKRAITLERLRECRAIQTAFNTRLGPLVVRKGYVAAPVVEAVVRKIRETVFFCSSCGTPHERRTLAPGAGCRECGALLAVGEVPDERVPPKSATRQVNTHLPCSNCEEPLETTFPQTCLGCGFSIELHETQQKAMSALKEISAGAESLIATQPVEHAGVGWVIGHTRMLLA